MAVSHHQSILGNLKVLLVEDEEKVREYIAKSLRYIVSEVQEASNGKDIIWMAYFKKLSFSFKNFGHFFP